MGYTETTSLALIFGIGLVGSLILTPVFRYLARRSGLVDAPDGRRKHQKTPVPLAGGLAIFATLALSLFSLYVIDSPLQTLFFGDPRLWHLVAAATFIVLLGLIDDARGMRGRHKLIGQLVVICILLNSGQFVIQKLELLGWIIDLGPFGVLFTIVWLLGVINAINLIDGMDGMLSSVGMIACLTFAVIAGMTQQLLVAGLALALAGSLLGFLYYNRPPATVYLGDCGSMLIGLLLGAMSIQGCLKGPAVVTLAPALALLVLPLFDTAAAIIRRKLTGRSIYTTDRGHLHHCLLRRGMTRVRVLIVIASLGMVAALGALATSIWRSDVYALIGAATVMITLIATRLFGHAEMMLIKERLVAKLVEFRHGHKEHEHSLQVRLQGSGDWDRIWGELTSAAFELNLRTICLDVNAPAFHENYHARWDRFGVKQEDPCEWKAELPLFINGQAIGRLMAVGRRDDEVPVWTKLNQLADLVERAEDGASRVTTGQIPKLAPQPELSIPTPVA